MNKQKMAFITLCICFVVTLIGAFVLTYRHIEVPPWAAAIITLFTAVAGVYTKTPEPKKKRDK